MVGDVRQTVDAESLSAHTLKALSGSGCPPFFNFFVILRGSACDGRNPLAFPRYRIITGRARVVTYTEEFIPRAWGVAQVPQPWAYGLYASCIRSLRERGTTLAKEIVLLLWDPIAQ